MSLLHNKNINKQNPNHLLDGLLAKYNLKNDAALCRLLDLPPPHISKMRHDALSVSAGVLVQIMTKTDMLLDELQELLYYPHKVAELVTA